MCLIYPNIISLIATYKLFANKNLCVMISVEAFYRLFHDIQLTQSNQAKEFPKESDKYKFWPETY